MTFIILSDYYDSKSEVIYSGQDLLEGIRLLSKHHCGNFRIEVWEDGKRTEVITK